MTITLPLWLVVSQWVLLFALGFLLFTLYRQIGFQMKFRDLGTSNEGLSLEERAPAFDYTFVEAFEKQNRVARFDPIGIWSLVMFADPGCVSCEQALLALERFRTKQGSSLRILVATSASSAQIAAIDTFRETTLPLGHVSHDVPYKSYQTLVTPFAFLIDPEGRIQAKGAVHGESSLRKIIQKVNHTTIQVVSATPLNGILKGTMLEQEENHV